MTKEEINALKPMLYGITAKDGVLYRDDVALHFIDADYIARNCGFSCFEQLVKAMGGERKPDPIVPRKVSNAIMEIGVNE